MWEYHLYAAAQSFCYTPNPPLQYLILNAWNISNSIKYCGTMYAAALYFLKPLQYLIHRYVELSNSIKYCGMTGGKTLRISLVLLESTKNKQGFYQNKTTLYEERKRNEAPRRRKLTGFSPVGKANRGKTQSLTFAHLCWILGRCHRSVVSVFVLNVLSWILVCNTCRCALYSVGAVGDAMTRKRL